MLVMFDRVDVLRNTMTLVDGRQTFVWASVGKRWCNIDMLENPTGPVMVLEAGTIPDRLGTLFFEPESNDSAFIKSADRLKAIEGPHTGIVISVESRPVGAAGVLGLHHFEAVIKEVPPAVQ